MDGNRDSAEPSRIESIHRMLDDAVTESRKMVEESEKLEAVLIGAHVSDVKKAEPSTQTDGNLFDSIHRCLSEILVNIAETRGLVGRLRS